MSTPSSPERSPASPRRVFNRQTLITAIALAGAAALRLSAQASLSPAIALAEQPHSPETPALYLALNELKQSLTDFTEDLRGDRSIHLPLQ